MIYFALCLELITITSQHRVAESIGRYVLTVNLHCDPESQYLSIRYIFVPQKNEFAQVVALDIRHFLYFDVCLTVHHCDNWFVVCWRLGAARLE